MPYVRLNQSGSGQVAWVDIDDVRFMEWRPADGLTDAFGTYTMARNRTDEDRALPYVVRSPS